MSYLDNQMSSESDLLFGVGRYSTPVETPKTNTPWSLDSLGNTVGGMIGTDAKGLQGLGSAIGYGAGIGNTLYGMYNQGQMVDLAKDKYNFEKGIASEQWKLAKEDRASALADKKRVADAYLGRTS
jgi:hypothetical protein